MTPAQRTRGVILTACFLAMPAMAHDLRYVIGAGQAVVIHLHYVDDTPFSYESYEILRPGEDLPFQVGNTDRLGRIAFLPDRAGVWRVRAMSEDGHGVDFTLTTDDAAQVTGADRPAFERYGRIAVGVGIILGLFGFLGLYVKRKKS